MKITKIASLLMCLFLFISAFSFNYNSPVDAEETVLPEFSPSKDLTAPLSGQPTIYDGAAGKEDGHDVLYTTSKSVPAMFNVIDLDENKLVRSLPLEGAADSWHHEVAPNGTVYIAAGSHLWGYSPETKAVTPLVRIPESSQWALAVDEDSNAYVGTFPGGKVFQYNYETQELRDYGKMIGEISQEYVRSMDYHNGFVYAGTAHRKIMKLNVETGEKEDISAGIPETESGFVYDINVVDDRYIFARYSETKNMYVYDIAEQRWLDVVMSNVSGLHVTDSLDHKVYFVADGTLKYIDLSTKEIGTTPMAYSSGLRGADWVEIEGDSQLPGKSLATITFNGTVTFFNIETQKVVQYKDVVPATANVINKIFSYSEDKMYISGMTGATGAVFNPKTGENKIISLGQADVIHSLNNKVYFGVYPEGSVQMIAPETDPYGKPEKLFVIENEQDRLHVMDSGDGKLYTGSMATYGKLGGALTVSDGRHYEVFRNVVQNQSISGLVYKDGKVFGSTTIRGGLGSSPTEEQGKLFIWDPETKQKIKESNLVIAGLEKPELIGELIEGKNDGYIWGTSQGYIFALDPETLDVVKSRNIIPSQEGWSASHLQWSENGLLYANIAGKLFVIDPETLASKFVVNTVSFAIGEDGDIYYSRLDNRTILSKIEVVDPGEYDWEEIPVENSSFEEDLSGWTNMFGTGDAYKYEISSEKAFSGSKSLKIMDQLRNQSVAVYSDPIPVQPGKEYKGEVMMFIESGTPSLLVRMYDSSGKQVKEEAIQVKSGFGSWQKVEQRITAPEGVVFARVFALSTSYALTDAYFDDFGFYERVKTSEILREINLTVDTNTLTRGDTTSYHVSGTLGNEDKIQFEDAVITSSNKEVVKAEDGKLVAQNPGTATITAQVSWNGKTFTSNEVEIHVAVTTDSLEGYITQLHTEQIIPHNLYKKLTNHIRQVKHPQENGNLEEYFHHLEVMKQHVDKWETDQTTVKETLLTDLSKLIEE
ncbi:hypothetical protein ABE41_017560 [Fictibacillus arsenicus]|uniref:Uncharacterized protein n=1 Tax=Fictibacillus arsenicus TaxID=255247 RepID=A0A1B1Z8V6_9BACL|nr:carbohydrate binding domain-containing protein [Fictibacillus arsenicus]ANX13821.1 hypothetical protein ABE41_017560 [Fictibacillus arsenicus]